MKIGIIGAGHIGGTLARLFAGAGHDVAIANSRGPQTLRQLVEEIGGSVRAATVDEAAAFGEVVVVSVPFGRYREIPVQPLAGKVVIDTNNYYPQRDGNHPELDTEAATSSGLLADHLRDARVVKAFNNIRFDHLGSRGRPGGDPDRIGLPLSGDDADAKRTVAALIDEIGFDPVDFGGLDRGGRAQQVGTAVYGADLTAAGLRTHRPAS